MGCNEYKDLSVFFCKLLLHPFIITITLVAIIATDHDHDYHYNQDRLHSVKSARRPN